MNLKYSKNLLKLKLKAILLNLRGYGVRLEIGRNVLVDDFVKFNFSKGCKLILRSNVYVGRLCTLGLYSGCVLELGRGVHLSQGTSISVYNSTKIGDNTIFGQNSVVIDGEHTNNNNCWKNSPIRSVPIKVGENVLIGTNCIILKGCEIGGNSVIGAGTLVSNKKIKPNSVYINKRKCMYLR